MSPISLTISPTCDSSSALRYDRIVESRRLREKETPVRNRPDMGRLVLVVFMWNHRGQECIPILHNVLSAFLAQKPVEGVDHKGR